MKTIPRNHWAVLRQRMRDIDAAHLGSINSTMVAHRVLNDYRSGAMTRLDPFDTVPERDSRGSYEVSMTRERLVQRSRDLDHSNPIAHGLLNRFVENVVERGHVPVPNTGDDDFNAAALELWNEWSETGADIRGIASFSELQQIWVRGRQRDGDISIILDSASGSLQTIEADNIETPPGKSATDNVFDGIECDAFGKPTKFHVAYQKPTGVVEHKEVDARDVIYWPRRTSTEQTRGEPVFSTVAHMFDMLDANIEAVIAASQMAAMLGLLIESKEGASQHSTLSQQSAASASGEVYREFPMEPAMVKFLAPGESVTQVNPTHPSANQVDFMRFVLRTVGAPLGMPLELVLLDFSQTNYSSARAALLQAQRMFKAQQLSLQQHVLRRVYRWRVSKWIKDGLLPKRDDAWRHEWRAPGWPAIDILKEAVGYLLLIDAGLMSGGQATAAIGTGDWSHIADQLRDEIQRKQADGIPIVHSKQTRDSLIDTANLLAKEDNDA